MCTSYYVTWNSNGLEQSTFILKGLYPLEDFFKGTEYQDGCLVRFDKYNVYVIQYRNGEPFRFISSRNEDDTRWALSTMGINENEFMEAVRNNV